MLFTNEHCYLIPTKEIGEANFCQMGLESIEPRLKLTGESIIKVRRTGYVMRIYTLNKPEREDSTAKRTGTV